MKPQHTFLDFLYFKLLTAVPLIAALSGLWKADPVVIIPYLLWIGLHISLVYRLLCSHCPHYGAYHGNTQCLYLWGVPAFYKARPVPQNLLEKISVMLLMLISVLESS